MIDFKLPEKWKNIPEDRNIIKEMKFIVKPTDKTEWGLGTIQRMETGLNQMELYIGLVKNKNKKDSIILSLVKDWKEKIVEVFDKQWSDWVTLTFKNSSGKREIGYFQCYLDFTKKGFNFYIYIL